MALLKAAIGILIVIILLGSGYIIYAYYFEGGVQNLVPGKYSHEVQESLINVSGDITQFYKNMRFNHNQISYFINNKCSSEKSQSMERAFSIISEKTGVLSFSQTFSEDAADILVGCSADSYEKEKNIFIAGEGGPTNITNSSYPVITKGKILLYSEEGANCEQPLLEIHELIHVLGYNHINKSNDIMFPYLDCAQQINDDLIEHIKKLYSIAPFAELYFSNVNAYKEDYMGHSYLNFNVSIENQGIIYAENIKLIVYADGKEISTFENKDIKYGASSSSYVKNLPLPSRSVSKVKLEVTTSTRELDKKNNIFELALE